MCSASFRKLRFLFLVLTPLSIGASSCSNSSRFQVGYAEYWIEFYDPVIDWTGRVQSAYCGRYLVFTGDIDTACSAFPMVWSYGQNAWVECTYLDSFGQRWYYNDLFYFWPGYIQERACFDGYDYPAAESDLDRNRSSELDRNEDGQLLLSELAGVSQDITLQEGDADLDELRDSLRQRLDSAAPSSLPEGELSDDPVRNTEPRLGEPRPELMDPDAIRTSQSELPRDERGRVLVEQDLNPSAEAPSLAELRERLRQRSDADPLPNELPSDVLGEPLRQSEPTLGELTAETDDE